MVCSGWLIALKVLMYGILEKKASTFFLQTGFNFVLRSLQELPKSALQWRFTL